MEDEKLQKRMEKFEKNGRQKLVDGWVPVTK